MSRADGGRREREALIAARVLEDGATLREAAVEFGCSREWVRRIVREQLAQGQAEQAALDEDEAALRLRYARGLELVESLEIEGRPALLAEVVWPARRRFARPRGHLRSC